MTLSYPVNIHTKIVNHLKLSDSWEDAIVAFMKTLFDGSVPLAAE